MWKLAKITEYPKIVKYYYKIRHTICLACGVVILKLILSKTQQKKKIKSPIYCNYDLVKWELSARCWILLLKLELIYKSYLYTIVSSIITRRPYTSEAAPINGDAINWRKENRDPIIPTTNIYIYINIVERG